VVLSVRGLRTLPVHPFLLAQVFASLILRAEAATSSACSLNDTASGSSASASADAPSSTKASPHDFWTHLPVSILLGQCTCPFVDNAGDLTMDVDDILLFPPAASLRRRPLSAVDESKHSPQSVCAPLPAEQDGSSPGGASSPGGRCMCRITRGEILLHIIEERMTMSLLRTRALQTTRPAPLRLTASSSTEPDTQDGMGVMATKDPFPVAHRRCFARNSLQNQFRQELGLSCRTVHMELEVGPAPANASAARLPDQASSCQPLADEDRLSAKICGTFTSIASCGKIEQIQDLPVSKCLPQYVSLATSAPASWRQHLPTVVRPVPVQINFSHFCRSYAQTLEVSMFALMAVQPLS